MVRLEVITSQPCLYTAYLVFTDAGKQRRLLYKHAARQLTDAMTSRLLSFLFYVTAAGAPKAWAGLRALCQDSKGAHVIHLQEGLVKKVMLLGLWIDGQSDNGPGAELKWTPLL